MPKSPRMAYHRKKSLKDLIVKAKLPVAIPNLIVKAKLPVAIPNLIVRAKLPVAIPNYQNRNLTYLLSIKLMSKTLDRVCLSLTL